MIALTLAAMAVVVFASRYLFLEPRLPMELGPKLRRLMGYATPAVLSAVIAPMVLIHQGQLNSDWQNPYLIGAIAAVLIMLLSKNTLLSTVLSMLIFVALKFWLFA
ncbi:AzlD domain-containing protein [Pseudoteredinibacter isoporae]|uniref:Branched-subunit amino acid transport protein n=1 Tax=Pseudoteredinibacter isoporae TaxID=570281 RepID=A0A7X0JPN0_9GAMM|nr:AzlD domain-containing protein [Pseudoteredinibacter isoporae]MBB6519987.1 branched-subunit amino acid transport protein [Pseudoteredinibacter isoporae]NHO85559.1 AzlD domain-containing protein [Pseudoteredinibacter isoporae]NIB25989.1 AzlD domain-containing protein [Pseudoteredinibacter isoporae]